MKLGLTDTIKLKWRCIPIKNKTERHKVRDAFLDEIVKKRVTKEKWGVAYSVYDGEELLEASIRSIRSEVDYICVVYQTKSWYGEPAHPELIHLLNNLQTNQLIDELIEYIPDCNIPAGKQELNKRNMGLRAAQKAGCTYYMTMDTDEFYKSDDLKKAKYTIARENLTHTYCNIFTYGLSPTVFLPNYCYHCQFFSRLTKFSKHQNDSHATAEVDPTRKLSHIPWWRGGSKYFVLPFMGMHHMSYLRKNISKKLTNSSSKEIQNINPDLIHQSQETMQCNDIFNLLPLQNQWKQHQALR